LLVRSRRGFEEGFRASLRAGAPSNRAAAAAAAAAATSPAAATAASAGSAGSDEARLDAILGVWGRLINLLQAARLTALGIALLALLDRIGRQTGQMTGAHAHLQRRQGRADSGAKAAVAAE
jgi:hypothetical protein